MGMKQKFIKRDKDRVTATKHNLYTFRGHLHLNHPHIRILSEIGLGMKSFDFLLQNPIKP